MKLSIFFFFSLFSSLAFAGQSADFFKSCNRGANLTPVSNMEKSVKILDENTFNGCPLKIVYSNDVDNLLSLQSTRDGVSGGRFSSRYEDIQPFVVCSYANKRESLDCGLQEYLVTDEILRDSTLDSLENNRRQWQGRN